ncbi:MAG: CBS domain-containing protein [Planctomycetota bacterium]|nr:MAG: CBS domain-containing protein [Planctomycetota bacterium]
MPQARRKARPHFRKQVLTIDPEASARQAAALMEKEGIGCLVVVDDEKPIGVVTDRDLALRVIAEGKDGNRTRVAAVMSHPAVTVSPADSFETVVQRMRKHGLRRMPVVEKGRLSGMVTLDDLMLVLSGEFSDVAEAARRGYWKARAGKAQPVPTAIQGYLGWAPHILPAD